MTESESTSISSDTLSVKMSRPSITRDTVTDRDKKSKCRAWCFTTYELDDINELRGLMDIKAICVGKEICPTTNRVHYQGYIRFAEPVRFSFWKNNYPRIHVERRIGNEYQAASYCRKDGDIIVDYGCDGPPRKKFKGDQHDQCAQMIANGCTKAQVHREMGPRYYYLNCRKIQDYCLEINNFLSNGLVYMEDNN